MSKPKILIFASREEPPQIIAQLEATGCDIAYGEKAWLFPRGQHEAALTDATRDAVALMGTSLRHTPITRRVMETSQRLRIVAKYTVGVDDVDTDAATDLGILVCHAPTESNCFGVAESTMAMLLAQLKKLHDRDAAVRAGKWREPELSATFLGARMSDGYAGITVGIVGLGRIGTRVAQLLAPWRVRILAYDPHIEPARFLLAGAQSVDYETLLRQSDVVSFHVVLTKETRYMLRAPQLALMKPSAIVINTARGKVV
jgi:D-3-phosphoglycerate dehydrogenase